MCGAITYRAKGEPLDVASCHCVTCRKMSGAAFTTFVIFSPDQFELTNGDIAAYAATPDYQRGYCRECGSSVISWRKSEADKWIGVWAGSLDQADKLEPRHHIFAKDELPWLHLEDGLPRYQKWPEKVLESLGLESTTRHAEFEER